MRRILAKNSVLPSLSSLGVVKAFSLKKTALHSIDYCLYVYVGSGADDKRYVFFDSNDEISLSSKVSTTTTPTSDSLQDFITAKSATNVYVNTAYFSDGYSITSASFTKNATFIYMSGVLCTLNGKAAIYFNGTANAVLNGTAISEMNDGNNWSIHVGANSLAVTTVLSLINTHLAGTYRFNMYIDRRSSVPGDIDILNTTSGIYYSKKNFYLNSSVKIFQSSVIQATPSKIKRGYADGIFQTPQVSWAGNYDNALFKVGAGFNNGIPLNGYIQEIFLCNIVNTDTEVFNIYKHTL